jgi:diaminopimelate epimerase
LEPFPVSRFFPNLFRPGFSESFCRAQVTERGEARLTQKAGLTPSLAALIVIATRHRTSKCIFTQTTISQNKMSLDSRADHQSMKGPVHLLSLRQVPTVRLCYRT